MDRTFLLVGALAGFIGVAFGAFGAHALRGRLSPDMLAVFETGVRYQMYHAFAVLIVAVATGRFDGWLVRAAGWSFSVGIVLWLWYGIRAEALPLIVANVVTLGLAVAILVLKWRYGRDIPPPHYGAEQEEEQ
jgi:hypothetical protein